MYSFSVTIDVAAPPARVWRALCDPAEVVQWDTGVVEALDAPPDYPQPGQHVRWGYASGPFRTLHDRPVEVVPERTLRSLISIGSLRFDETYTLETNGGGTRLTASMDVSAPPPVLGMLIERWYAGPQARRTVETSLRAIKKHCEQPPSEARPEGQASAWRPSHMRALDPKRLAQEKFAQPDTLGIEIIGRFATDPPVTVRTLLDAIAQRAGAGSRVIELGFGSGWLLEELPAALPKVRLYGLDLSPGNAKRAQELYGEGVSIVIGDMERLPFADSTFDVMVTCWTLYFMRDIDTALAEFTRCLRPGGRLIAATSAHDHEIEAEELVAEAIRVSLGREAAEPDVGRRFDLESGGAPLEWHFPRVDVREWHGEMVLTELEHVLALWPKWQPAGLDASETERVRAQFALLVEDRLGRDGSLHISRHERAFICDLADPKARP